MKINELLYKTPEMTEVKLLEFIKNHIKFLRKYTINKINEIYKYDEFIENSILKEWDLIQEKKSILTRSQRDEICALVSFCLIQMTRDDGTRTNK